MFTKALLCSGFEQGLDLFGSRALERLVGELLGLIDRPLGDGLARTQDARRRGGELFHAPRDQQRREQRIGSGLAAHTDHDALLDTGLDDVLDCAQHRRIVPAVKVGDLVVATVGRHGIAGEVVGTDGEEVGFLSQKVGDVRGGSGLGHDADLDILVELVALFAQLGLADLDELLDGTDLLDAGDHGNHDLDVAERARTQQGAELDLVLIGVIEAVADGAVTHEGVLFLHELEIRDLLVAAHVERTDDDRIALQGNSDLAIRVELLLLGGQRLGVHEEELGAEQADSLGIVLERALDVIGLPMLHAMIFL